MRGRRPKPPQLKLLQGNPGHRKVNIGPRFAGDFGSCPKHLTGQARKLWCQLARELDEKGLSSRPARGMFEGLCFHYGEWRRHAEFLTAAGPIVQGPDGLHPRPEIKMLDQAYQSFRLAAAEFGLSPASNGKVSVPKRARKSLRDELMGK
jgi:P27 family predicted phage terminase small subunit